MIFTAGGRQSISTSVQNGTGSGSWRASRCAGDVNFTVSIQSNGAFTVVFEGYNQSCQRGTSRHSGTVQGNTLSFPFRQGNSFTLKH